MKNSSNFWKDCIIDTIVPLFFISLIICILKALNISDSQIPIISAFILIIYTNYRLSEMYIQFLFMH